MLSPRTRPFALVAATLAMAAGCDRSPTMPSASSSQPAAAISVQEVRFPAVEQAVKEQLGKVVVVDFWATWCGPCVAKFPHLVEIHKKFADRGLTCMTLSMDKYGPRPYNRDLVLEFLRKKGADFPNFVIEDLAADETKFKQRFGVGDGIPYLVVLDRTGKPVWNSDDNVSNRRQEVEELDSFLERLVAQK